MESREGIALQNQILELRHQVQLLQDQLARGGGGGPYPLAPPPNTGGSFLGYGGSRAGPPGGAPPSSDLVTQLLDRVSALEDQVRSLRGQMDEISNQTRQQGQDFGKQIGDLSFRLQNVEEGRGAGGRPPPAPPSSPGLPPSPTGGAGPPPPPGPPAPRRPELILQEGNAALARRDYAMAESNARDVLANHRTSPRAYDAQLLLAEVLAGKRDWSQAAIAFDDAYNRSRTGSHAQDSLIGLANSLIALGDKRAGCAALNKLRAEFPNPRPDLRDPIAAARQRGGCA